ncbi:Hypothetical predicted protein [Paramuricea clavata]|uniref:Uncharacterized protein n=1 Tax=Paramuricea clavata TaxID=317549 RepID=A0A6S7JY12_PARCT|nr:Hypothetical predicted protein [Paramuricea clavata]
MLRLQPYNFRVIYKKGTVNEADYLSRHPTTTKQKTTIEEKIADNYVNYIINNAVPKSMTLQEIKEATLSDTNLKKVLECLKSGKWEEKDVELKAYQMCAEELTATKAGDLLSKGSRIKPNNKLSPRFNPERFTIVERKGATSMARNGRRTITRNVTHFKVVKPVDEQSSDEEKSTTVEDVQDNRIGDDMQDFIEESHSISRR